MTALKLALLTVLLVFSFYKRLKASDDDDEVGNNSDSSEESTSLCSSPTAVDPFGRGVKVIGATKTGNVKKGKVMQKHSIVYVFILWEGAKYKKKVREHIREKAANCEAMIACRQAISAFR